MAIESERSDNQNLSFVPCEKNKIKGLNQFVLHKHALLRISTFEKCQGFFLVLPTFVSVANTVIFQFISTIFATLIMVHLSGSQLAWL